MGDDYKFTVYHGGNMKVHFYSEKEMKDYVDGLGRTTIKVVKHSVVFDRTPSRIRMDRF